MLFGKKEDKSKLPDLPLPKSNQGFFGIKPKQDNDLERKISLPSKPSTFDNRTLDKPVDKNPAFRNEDFEDDEDSDSERHALPSFPDSPMKKGFSQAAIKDAIGSAPPEEEDFPIPQEPRENQYNRGNQDNTITQEKRTFKTIELEDHDAKIPVIPSITEIRQRPNQIKQFNQRPRPHLEQFRAKPMENIRNTEDYDEPLPSRPTPLQFTPKQITKNADVFIRIDKFRAARHSLDEIKTKIDEVEELLKKIRDTKMREEQELSGWESDLNSIKGKIKTVTENIFEKLE